MIYNKHRILKIFAQLHITSVIIYIILFAFVRNTFHSSKCYGSFQFELLLLQNALRKIVIAHINALSRAHTD